MKHFIKICIATGLSLLISTAVLSTTAQAAGMYKWTDEQGNVHYSQQRPQGKQYEKMKVDKAPRSSGTTTTPSYSSQPSATDDLGSRAVTDEVAKNLDIRKKNCEAAKNNLKTFQVYRRVKGEDGKIRVVSPEERKKGMETAKEQIREFCD